MKSIQPINIWANGSNKQASKLDVYIIHDDLKTSCTFYYALIEQNEKSTTTLTDGNLTMSGEVYEGWNGDNEVAVQWIVEQLNLTINE